MEFIVEPMDRDAALEIATWTYDAPYDFYNMNGNQEAIDELLNRSYFRVLDEQQFLAGFCCLGNSAQVPIDGTYSSKGSLTRVPGKRTIAVWR